MNTSGPLNATTRDQLRAYLATLAGRRHSWPHLALRHNSLAHAQPCRLCDHGVAQPAEGPALFWGSDPLCPSCAAVVAPELATYHAVLAVAIHQAGGDWRDLRGAA